MRQARIGGDNGVAQRLHHLRLHVVGKVAAGLRRGHLAPAVLDLLLLGQRVVHAGKELGLIAQHTRNLARGGLPLGAIAVGQQGRGRLQPQGLTIDDKLQPRDGLIEQAVPCGRTHGGLIVQEFLQLVGQLVGLHGAQPVEDRLVAGQIRIGGEQPIQMRVLQPVDLKAVKHQCGGGVRDPLLRVAEELRPRPIGRVLIVAQARKGHQPPSDQVDLLIGLHTGQHPIGIKVRQLALIGRGKLRAGRVAPVQIAQQLRRVLGGIEIRQIPVRQIAQIARAPLRGVIGGLRGRGAKRERGELHVRPSGLNLHRR